MCVFITMSDPVWTDVGDVRLQHVQICLTFDQVENPKTDTMPATFPNCSIPCQSLPGVSFAVLAAGDQVHVVKWVSRHEAIRWTRHSHRDTQPNAHASKGFSLSSLKVISQPAQPAQPAQATPDALSSEDSQHTEARNLVNLRAWNILRQTLRIFVPNEVTMGQAELANQMGAYYRRRAELWIRTLCVFCCPNFAVDRSIYAPGVPALLATLTCGSDMIRSWDKLDTFLWNSMKLDDTLIFQSQRPFSTMLVLLWVFWYGVTLYVLQSYSRWHQAMSPGAPQQAVLSCCQWVCGIPPLLLVPTGAGASSPDLMYQSRRYVTQVNESFVQQYGTRNPLRACWAAKSSSFVRYSNSR